jgi:hypothetical protein
MWSWPLTVTGSGPTAAGRRRGTNRDHREADAYRWLIDGILASSGRKLTASGRELATLAGIAPATFAT